MALVAQIEMTEEERLRLLKLRSEIESYELLLSGGGVENGERARFKYNAALNDMNELKREMLEDHDQLQDSFDYTYYFDTVAGMVWIEDAE